MTPIRFCVYDMREIYNIQVHFDCNRGRILTEKFVTKNMHSQIHLISLTRDSMLQSILP